MTPKPSLENQRRFVAEKKAQGLKRLTLWVKPEDVEIHQMAAHQPHALNRLRQKVERELRPQLEANVAAKLQRRTERAMLAQKRAQARRQTAGSNRPPELIRFVRRPPGAVRNRIKAAGWLYDPVSRRLAPAGQSRSMAGRAKAAGRTGPVPANVHLWQDLAVLA